MSRLTSGNEFITHAGRVFKKKGEFFYTQDGTQRCTEDYFWRVIVPFHGGVQRSDQVSEMFVAHAREMDMIRARQNTERKERQRKNLDNALKEMGWSEKPLIKIT